MSSEYLPPMTDGQRTILDTWFHKRREDQLRDFIASMVDAPPLVNLADPLERSCAIAAGKGYVAGLAGTRTQNPYGFDTKYLGSNPFSRAWRCGWEQGRNHRARSVEACIPRDVISRERMKAMLIRTELPPV